MFLTAALVFTLKPEPLTKKDLGVQILSLDLKPPFFLLQFPKQDVSLLSKRLGNSRVPNKLTSTGSPLLFPPRLKKSVPPADRQETRRVFFFPPR